MRWLPRQRRCHSNRNRIALEHIGDVADERRRDVAPTVADPCPGQAGDAARFYAVVRADANHHLFDIAHVAVHVAAVRLQVEDRVADDLSWAVIGDVAASSGLVYADA